MASGYPHRMRFRAFSGRYRALWRRGGGGGGAGGGESGAACAAVLRAVQAAAAPPAPASPAAVRWALGKRHVFLSEGMRQVFTSFLLFSLLLTTNITIMRNTCPVSYGLWV